MTGSRWADTAEDKAAEERRKQERAERKRLKAQKQAEQEAQRLKQQEEVDRALERGKSQSTISTKRELTSNTPQASASEPPAKRQRTSPSDDTDEQQKRPLLRPEAPQWSPSRLLSSSFEALNHIEEGSYGTVSRAREINTGDIVALKKLKMDNSEVSGFPVTALREIQCLQAARHENIVALREVVVGTKLDETYLVMDFIEHDLKTLLQEKDDPFTPSEVKTLLHQLTGGVAHLHSHWILHRDIKTSNILLTNRGELKIADFGMARHTADPPPELTQLVVTLWYRAPELLLGATTYDGSIDIWSIGCVFAELLNTTPIMAGKNEVSQLAEIFAVCGAPEESTWPGWRRLPNARGLKVPPAAAKHADVRSLLRGRFPTLTNGGTVLLASMLALDPAQRPTAAQILQHEYFSEAPRPKAKELFPSFPSKAGLEKRRRIRTPSAPRGGEAPNIGEADFRGIFGSERDGEMKGGGWSLRV